MVIPTSKDEVMNIEVRSELDQFSQYYADFLDGTYDCVDRIVLNAYFQLAQTPGGLRVWWRELYGSDDKLDKTHLMRIAGRFGRRLSAYAEKEGIPIIDVPSGQRKHEIAAQYLPQNPDFVGVFVILTGRASAPVFDVKQNKAGKISDIQRKYAYVKQYHFHIMDPDWGHIIIKLNPHPPFGAQIILNGHEYVARQADKAGLAFSKEGNCFTHIAHPTDLAQIADTLCDDDGGGQLSQLCERWIYSSCLCFALTLEEQARTNFRYRYSTYQMEYSRNLLFQRGGQMEQLFNSLIDRVRAKLEVPTLKTIFGTKRRPFRHNKHKAPRLEVVVENPAYNLTVFKIHCGQLTVKLYTKGERVLRIEIIIHNTKALPYGRALPKFPEIANHLQEILDRFLNILHCVDNSFISGDTLDTLPTSSQVGQTRVGGINLNQSRIRAVIEAVIALAPTLYGFTASTLAAKVRAILGVSEHEYTPRQAAYDLKKLRGKALVCKIDGSRRYEPTADGLAVMTALLILREKVIKPVFAGATKPKCGPKPKHQSPIDAIYQTIQLAMRNLFEVLGIAV
jgi:hypothetical protein